MRLRKTILLTLCAVLVSLSVLTGLMPAVLADEVYAEKQTTNSAIQQKQNEIKVLESRLSNVEKEIKKTNNAISDAETALENEQKRKQLLDEQLALIAQSVDATEELVAAYEEQIAGKNGDIADKQAEIDAQYASVLEWMRLAYELTPASYLELILSTKSFAEFLDSVEMYTSMMDYQTSLMQKLNGELADIREEKDALDIYRAELQATQDKLDLQVANYQKLIKESESYAKELEKKLQEYEKQNQESQAERKKLIASREQLNKQLEEELAKLAQQNAVYVGGKYIWPVNAVKYKRVSSPFGPRNLYGTYNNHTGIDIPCDYGADVWASNAGTVVKATWHYSYGYYVVIDHGGGQTTLYAHNSRLIVKEGQTVKQGQVIAKAGATGSAYGNHCHFEVRINGKAVNPLKGYLTQPK